MLKKLSLAVVVALACATTAQAANSNTFDLGIRGGYAFLSNQDDGKDVVFDEDQGYGLGIFGTYNITSWFGVDVGYNYFDNFSYTYDNKVNEDFYAHGPEVALRFAYPFGDLGSDVYLRTGVMYSMLEDGVDDDSWAPLVGVGVKWNFTYNFAVRAGFDYYFNVLDDVRGESTAVSNGTLSSDLGLAYVGFNYTFGNAPVAEPEPVVEPAPAPKTYSLNASSLFAFDGSTLSEDGKNNIANVVSDIKANATGPVAIDILGYADRIGNDAYNQKLSQKRAEAVSQALINAGVDQGSIRVVEGKGEASPVTGTTCDNLKGSKLIDCLAPDRRVEIVINSL